MVLEGCTFYVVNRMIQSGYSAAVCGYQVLCVVSLYACDQLIMLGDILVFSPIKTGALWHPAGRNCWT
jgi:hypothetical protein